ncbi:hypothetical protein [Pseudoalteromonas sp. PA2MD11]|uniref:hypothetical protein n=1 Tax=Pseudoalteromonas sp. PA2MD11 TaxID=2785057 RepID=UPI001ADF60AB|nr:hypothetical protein [Pseudoalteromonas sp. PA2MD11]
MKGNILLHSLYILVSALGGYYSIGVLTYKDFNPAISVLQNISAAVFTLSGIWIAYLYPQAISSITSSSKVGLIKGSEDAKRVENLVYVVSTSALVLFFILLINVFEPIFNKVISVECKQNFDCIIVSCIFYLTIIQSFSILKIIASNLDFVYRLSYKVTEKKVDDELSK